MTIASASTLSRILCRTSFGSTSAPVSKSCFARFRIRCLSGSRKPWRSAVSSQCPTSSFQFACHALESRYRISGERHSSELPSSASTRASASAPLRRWWRVEAATETGVAESGAGTR